VNGPAPRFVGDTELPWDAGRFDAGRVYWGDVGPAAVVDPKAPTPTDLARDHVLFNAGVLHHLSGNDQVALHWAEEAATAGPPPVLLELGCRLFAGEMPASAGYDRVVFACPGQAWPALKRRLDRVAFAADHGPPRGLVVWESLCYCWPALDPVLARRLTAGRPAPAGPPPLVPVYLYGVAGPSAAYVWEPARDPWRDPLCLKFTNRPPTPPPTPRPPRASSSPRRR
jgi:hypothetical protein